MKHRINNSVARKEQRRKTAERIASERNKRSDKDQLARLEARGHGHCKEVERLKERIDE